MRFDGGVSSLPMTPMPGTLVGSSAKEAEGDAKSPLASAPMDVGRSITESSPERE
jgi:hypothetical protein